MPSFILIRPTVWPKYTNVTDKRDRQDNGPIAKGEPFYKQSPKNRAFLLTWQKQDFAQLSSSRYCSDRAQNLPGPAPRMWSECFAFHRNWFTFGGVVPDRVNTAKTARKVFPTFG